MRFSGFSTNYVPLQHVDLNGSVIDSEKKHVLAQGWLQTFTVLNQIMQGYWEKTPPTPDGVSHCSFTPWQAIVNVTFAEAKPTVTFTLPIPYYGIVTKYKSDNSVDSIIHVSGNTFTTSVNAGDFISGTLAP